MTFCQGPFDIVVLTKYTLCFVWMVGMKGMLVSY